MVWPTPPPAQFTVAGVIDEGGRDADPVWNDAHGVLRVVVITTSTAVRTT
ncbi:MULTISPECIES: hypothetical protein [unclassified Microbacterium]|nr:MULTISPECIES: hypothetical protein [unclassified Microbacterium]